MTEEIDKIVRALGWTSEVIQESDNEDDRDLDERMGIYGGATVWRDPEGRYYGGSPHAFYKQFEYLTEAIDILILKRGRAREYGLALYAVVDEDSSNGETSMSDCMHDPVEIGAILSQATIEQRVKALIKVIETNGQEPT